MFLKIPTSPDVAAAIKGGRTLRSRLLGAPAPAFATSHELGAMAEARINLAAATAKAVALKKGKSRG